jgi:hypothetical protein
MANPPPPPPCPSGQTCLRSDGDPAGGFRCAFDPQTFCADAPPLDQNSCFPQLTAYQVNANASFTIQGSASGSFAAGTTDDHGACRPFRPDERDPRLVSRIRLQPAPGDTTPITCDPGFPSATDASADGFHFERFDPRIEPSVINGQEQPVMFGSSKATPEAPQLVTWMKGWAKDVNAPNACAYLAGPVIGDPASSPDPNTRAQRSQHVRIRFRNTQVAFVIANIDRPTLEISAPARIVLGPVDSNPSTSVNTARPAPFFFVVDQRRLGTGQGGGPTRGQIIRVAPFGQPTTVGFLPAYEDYQRSGGLFPIQ